MTVYEFLDTHPGIRMSWLEKEVGVTHGTFRKGRIPKRYMNTVIRILSDYGFMGDYTPESFWEKHKREKKERSEKRAEVRLMSGDTYVVRKGVVGKIDGELFFRADLEDGTIVKVVGK